MIVALGVAMFYASLFVLMCSCWYYATREATMFVCTVTMPDKTVHRFECETANEALEKVDRDFVGWKHLVAKSDNAHMEFGKRQFSKDGY